jgi:hypothetical protein
MNFFMGGHLFRTFERRGTTVRHIEPFGRVSMDFGCREAKSNREWTLRRAKLWRASYEWKRIKPRRTANGPSVARGYEGQATNGRE